MCVRSDPSHATIRWQVVGNCGCLGAQTIEVETDTTKTALSLLLHGCWFGTTCGRLSDTQVDVLAASSRYPTHETHARPQVGSLGAPALWRHVPKKMFVGTVRRRSTALAFRMRSTRTDSMATGRYVNAQCAKHSGRDVG